MPKLPVRAKLSNALTIVLLGEVYGLFLFQSTKDFNQTFKKPRENCGLVMDVPVRSVGVKKAIQKEWVGSTGHGRHRATKIINKTNQINQTTYFVVLLRIASFTYLLFGLDKISDGIFKGLSEDPWIFCRFFPGSDRRMVHPPESKGCIARVVIWVEPEIERKGNSRFVVFLPFPPWEEKPC